MAVVKKGFRKIHIDHLVYVYAMETGRNYNK